MTETLQELIRSTVELYTRFGQTFNIDAQLPIFEEEVRELVEAAREGTDVAHIAEETGDVFVTAIGLALAVGVQPEQLMQQTQAVIQKNDAKTHTTHYVNEHGKIARRKPKA